MPTPLLDILEASMGGRLSNGSSGDYGLGFETLETEGQDWRDLSNSLRNGGNKELSSGLEVSRLTLTRLAEYFNLGCWAENWKQEMSLTIILTNFVPLASSINADLFLLIFYEFAGCMGTQYPYLILGMLLSGCFIIYNNAII